MSVGISSGRSFWMRAMLGFGIIVLLTGTSLGLPRSYKPEIRCPQGPTASKTQSKLWFNDGVWWGVLFDGTSEEYRIYRYDGEEQAWADTGTLVDARNASRSDVLWDDGRLYVVSAGTESGIDDHDVRFSRYSYDPSTKSYSLDQGFPAKVAEGGTEAVSIARDTTGELWASYMQDGGDDLRRVHVTHTLGGDDARWAEPYTPSLRGTTGNSDDVAGVVAFGSQVGLAWSNQNDASGKSGFYFATHEDGAPDDEWQPDGIVKGAGWANDHLNLKADSEGRVYVALKTRWDRIDREPDKPFSMLWVRGPNGGWESHVFGTVGDAHTRSLVLIDEQQRQLYMFASAPTCSGGKVYYKSTSLDDISFEEGRGELFMQSADGTPIGDASSTKQGVDGTTGALVVASNKARDYYYNAIDVNDREKLFPDGAPIKAVEEE
ncbi:MAG TPA: hypothetical protein VK357_15615 [Rubrobacteraceae bacterium]|nr:hypothetical protein [Rubrobacteraceae bacterium]